MVFSVRVFLPCVLFKQCGEMPLPFLLMRIQFFLREEAHFRMRGEEIFRLFLVLRL